MWNLLNTKKPSQKNKYLIGVQTRKSFGVPSEARRSGIQEFWPIFCSTTYTQLWTWDKKVPFSPHFMNFDHFWTKYFMFAMSSLYFATSAPPRFARDNEKTIKFSAPEAEQKISSIWSHLFVRSWRNQSVYLFERIDGNLFATSCSCCIPCS